jgi:hypothetical protein
VRAHDPCRKIALGRRIPPVRVDAEGLDVDAAPVHFHEALRAQDLEARKISLDVRAADHVLSGRDHAMGVDVHDPHRPPADHHPLARRRCRRRECRKAAQRATEAGSSSRSSGSHQKPTTIAELSVHIVLPSAFGAIVLTIQ